MAFHLARDLPGTGSKIGACGVTGTIESSGFTAASRQIAGQATLRPPARIKGENPSRAQSEASNLLRLIILAPTKKRSLPPVLTKPDPWRFNVAMGQH